MNVFVINLDRHPDRLIHMRDQLRGVPFERVTAVDGAKHAETARGLSRFELACVASHRAAWRRFLSGDSMHACFLEDDIHLWPTFAALVDDESWIPSDAHSVKLDTYLQRVKLGERRPVLNDRQIARLYSRHESSAAYLLSRAGAERYLELTEKPVAPADYALFPKNARRLGLRVYQLTPAIAIQDHLRSAEEGGQSFATAMAGGQSARARGKSPLSRVLREGVRLAEQAADAREAIYLRTFLKLETTTVRVG
jgi:GR25 family glycosyltransferase involved in LPS biosynthesis